jgi:hypothetical protein
MSSQSTSPRPGVKLIVSTNSGIPGEPNRSGYDNATYRSEADYLVISCDSTDKKPVRIVVRVPMRNIVQVLEVLPEVSS